jgi:2-oxo-3-hexenedioate decarboxylase
MPILRCVAEVDTRVLAAVRAQLDGWRALLAGGAERVGWKASWEMPEVEALIGSEPVIGHLTTATQLEPGGTYRGGGVAVRAETEVVILAGVDGGVAALGVGLEIVDVGVEPRALEESIAGNVLHRGFALGPVGPLGDEATMTVNGEVRHRAPVTGDHAATLRSVARWLTAAGERLEPGDVVFAGSLNHVPVASGDHVEAAISGLGSVTATIG